MAEKSLTVRLECKTGGSNKFYTVRLVSTSPNNSLWDVEVIYGRINQGNPITQVKYVALGHAQGTLECDKIIANKIKKGYKKVSSTMESHQPSATAKHSSKKTESSIQRTPTVSLDRFSDLDLE
jgi:predicted DNA-binding WGR domain protein